MKISTFYRKRIKLIANNNITNYLNKFKNNKTTLYYDNDTYYKYKDVLKLDKLNIFELIDIDKMDIKVSPANKNTSVLILVKYFSEYFVNHMHIYKYLNDNNLYTNDIYADLLLDMDILLDHTFNLLWNNITKLESSLSEQDCNFIIQQEYSSYSELFENMLLKNNLVQKNDTRAIIQLDSYYDTFGSISKYIKNLIVLCTTNESQYNFFYGVSYLRFFTFIDFFIGTSLTQLPIGSKFININHGIVDDPGGFIKEDEYTYKQLYYFFREKNLNTISISIYSSDLAAGSRAISLGYPKLDKFIRHYSKNKDRDHDRKTIVVAVSSRQFNFTNINPIVQDREFINTILDNFNDFKVIFRPHPYDIRSKYVLDYKDGLEKYQNFEFDDKKSYLDNFTNAKVFISDGLGSSAYTYAFATLKPVIFYIPKWSKYVNDYGHTNYVKNLHILGDVVTNKRDLVNMIHKYLANNDHTQKKSKLIKNFRDKNIFNIGSSEKKIAQFINKYVLIQKSSKIRRHYNSKLVKKSKEKINNFFNHFKGKKIAIYGAGDHFDLVLKKIYNLKKLNIVCFSDSDTNLIGGYKYGLPIVSKELLQNTDVVLISSRAYEKEILRNLSRCYTNIYTIYDVIGPEIDIYLNSFEEKNSTYSWLNIQSIEQKLDEDSVDTIISANHDSYSDLYKSCQSILLEKCNEKVYHTNSLRDFYGEEKVYCIS